MKKPFIHLFISTFLITLGCVFLPVGIASADVAPGDTIDKTNWEKAGGMLPESVLNWVKKGDWTLDISRLTADTRDCYPDYVKALAGENAKTYDVNEQGALILKSSGEEADYVAGIPFPQIDTSDPKAGYKILYNTVYGRQILGSLDFSIRIIWVGRSGYEREVFGKYRSIPYVGFPGHKEMPNPDGFMQQLIISITDPYDIAGTSVMLWRYIDSRHDNNYSYVPAIRRCRRTSPASRSDAFLGSDFCLDDTGGGFDGKVPSFEVKFLRVQDALIPFNSEEPYGLDEEADGGLAISPNNKTMKFGYETEGWTGAPWAITNLVWVKLKTYVLQLKSKDAYYNYGEQELWIEAGRCGPCYKVINDRSGTYWKTALTSMVLTANADRTFRSIENAAMVVVDDRKDHASISEQMSPNPKTRWGFKQKLNSNDFTLGGFQKYCK